jgi:hypothetical protein
MTGDLDDRLRQLGQQWRDAQPDPPSPRSFDARVIGLDRTLPWTTFSAVFVVFIVAVLAMWRVLGGDMSGGIQGGPIDGEAVEARGIVIRNAAGQTRICDTYPEDLGGRPKPAQCTPIAVRLDDVEVERLPGWTVVEGTGSSDRVLVTGSWRAGGISAVTVSPSPPMSASEAEAPCHEIEGREQPVDRSSLEYEAALARLSAITERDKSDFAGFWVASARGLSAPVAVVNTVRSPLDVRDRLTTEFQYPLCIHEVPYSGSALDAARSVIMDAHPEWGTRIDAQQDKVIVRVVVVDALTARVLSARPEATADPLVVRTE